MGVEENSGTGLRTWFTLRSAWGAGVDRPSEGPGFGCSLAQMSSLRRDPRSSLSAQEPFLLKREHGV